MCVCVGVCTRACVGGGGRPPHRPRPVASSRAISPASPSFTAAPRPTARSHPPAAPAVFTGEEKVKVTDKVPFEKVWIAWHSPALYAPGDAELDLAASALSEGKESRLYKALVHDKQLAQDVTAYQGSQAWESLFVVSATAASGHTGDELVAAIDTVLAGARKDGITATELEMGRKDFEVQFFRMVSTIQGKADILNGYVTRTGDAGYLQKDLARYTSTTVESVNAALRQWLPPDKHLVLTFVPEAK